MSSSGDTPLMVGDGQDNRVCSAYLEQVADIPQVQMVLSEQDGMDKPRIWTIISAPPFDLAYTRPVYEAESAASQLADSPVVDFRLLNTQELSVPLEDALPRRFHVLYRA